MCQSVSRIKNAFLLLLGVNCDNAGWIFRAKIWTSRKIVVTLHPLWDRRRDVGSRTSPRKAAEGRCSRTSPRKAAEGRCSCTSPKKSRQAFLCRPRLPRPFQWVKKVLWTFDSEAENKRVRGRVQRYLKLDT